MNMKCTSCGADISAVLHACPFCKAVTPAGHAAAAAAAQHAQAAQAQAEYQARQAQAYADQVQQHERFVDANRLRAATLEAFMWSVGAMIFCCLPGPQIVAIVRYFSVRSLAKKLGQPVPGKATAALVMAIVSVGLGIVAIIVGDREGERQRAEEKTRIAELDKIAVHANAAVLERATACALAEKYVLTEGAGQSRAVSKFDCPGRLTAETDQAELEDFRYQVSGTAKTTSVCFKRGERWYVSKVVEGRCATTNTAPAASPPPPVPSTPGRRR